MDETLVTDGGPDGAGEPDAVLERERAELERARSEVMALHNQAFEGSTSYLDTNLRAQWERNIRQHRAEHPIGSKYLSETWKHKSRFFRPKTRAAVRKSEAAAAAALFSTADVVDLSAYDDNDPVQQSSAALWKEVLNYRLTYSVPWFVSVMGAYQDAQVMGAVVSYQDWDFEADCFKSELRPLENIRIDPAANWLDPIRSSPYVIDMISMYVHEVKEKAEAGEWRMPVDGQLSAARADKYDSTRLAREGKRTDPKEGANTGISDFDVVWVHRVIMRMKGADMVYYTLHDQFLLSDPVPVQQNYPWLRRRMRPYTMGVSVIEAHRIYPPGPVELAAPVQNELNEVINQRRDNVRLVLDKRYFVKRNRQVDIRSLTRNIAASVTMMDDPEGDVVAQEWNDVTGSAYQEEDRLNLDHDDLTGTFSGSSVQSNRNLNETVGGMNQLSSDARMTGDYTLKTFVETWLEPTMNQILLLEQYYESDAVILAFAGKKAKIVQRFGISTIDDELLRQRLTMRINIGMGSTNPLNNIERFMLGVNSLAKAFGPDKVASRLNFDAVSAELFGKLGYKDGARFLLDQNDPRVAELMRQISELQQQLALKRSPEVDAATAKLKAAQALKTMIEAVFGATQAAEIIAAIPEAAPVADEVLRAAGYQEPSPPGMDPNLVAPERPSGQVVPLRPNTSPLEPAVPASAAGGMNAGIEGGR